MANTLNDTIKDLRKRKAATKHDSKHYVACWSEKDVGSDGKVADALVAILRTRGCSWALAGGCSMCGYINDTMRASVPDSDLITQFSACLEKHKGQRIVKIYTSGSFFDDTEISPAVRDDIIRALASGGKVERISVESRPEFILPDRLNAANNAVKSYGGSGRTKFEVAIGLESANDAVLEKSINKGFRYADYKKAASVLRDNDMLLKTYLLVKPPFLSEREAIDDTLNSVRLIAPVTQTISFNPVNIQNYTLVESLWKRGEYRPPWLWSVVEILRKSDEIVKSKASDENALGLGRGRPHAARAADAPLEDGGAHKPKLPTIDLRPYIRAHGVRLMSSPTGGGTRRGAHNCGKCDDSVLDAIKDYSLRGDARVFDGLSCGCIEEWKDALELEGMSYGAWGQ